MMNFGGGNNFCDFFEGLLDGYLFECFFCDFGGCGDGNEGCMLLWFLW